ncbi:hypothetical protein TREMEDRAFT_59259 [Tremella mesenterica DSM 1558]|uniref:uncharacterized protein n=1 Tax=Tremella mesenterica (strain ATCC 24925 / CBS 8224 / DSM 1558 / NBRC 9311 / NRRL Y-6157 / RJB 2259-6 / UBC 559-6) TaxID=578456 RepID=UPI0003F49054|nr:uncharacterized protein TREMEDRAFT_59259 [Tremella mesenterica DSM 1558]EIW73096.1 hypothetical protein TREMEDRAFT_59259 [Tremella mesenterica DSM 1558]
MPTFAMPSPSTAADRVKLAGRRLTHWIENEHRLVTFREVAREVGCHNNEAKNLLLSHYTSHPSLYPTYILTGNLLPTSSLTQTQIHHDGPSLPAGSLAHLGNVRIVDMDQVSDDERNSEDGEIDLAGELNDGKLGEMSMGSDEASEDGIKGGIRHDAGGGNEDEEMRVQEVERWGVVLVGKEKLEEKKTLFRPEVNIHIYSLSPGPINDPAQYLIPSVQLRSMETYHNPQLYGTITGDAFVSEAKMKDGGMSFDKKSGNSSKDKSKESSKTVTLEKEKVEAVKTSSTKGSKVKDKGKNEKEKEGEELKVKKELHQNPNKDKSKKKPSLTPNQPNNPVSSHAEPSTTTNPSSSQRQRDDTAAMEAMMSMDVDMNSDSDQEAEFDSGEKAIKNKSEKRDGDTIVEGGRKRRKVKKSKSEMNEKGYMVTKDYWSEESISGDDDSSPTLKEVKEENKTQASKMKMKPPPVVAPKRGGSGQSTLQGFFKKK